MKETYYIPLIEVWSMKTATPNITGPDIEKKPPQRVLEESDPGSWAWRNHAKV